MKPLVDDMVQDDPTKRPDIDEVVKRFDDLVRPLSLWNLRSRLVQVEEKQSPLDLIIRSVHHFFRTTIHILTFKNPLPHPHT